MFCKYCGKEVDDNAKFCNSCGKDREITKAENKNEKTYDKDIEKYIEKLKPKDGNKHVLLVNMIISMFKDEEEEFNIKINTIIEEMQKRQYEIVDMKLCSPVADIYKTLIIYR